MYSYWLCALVVGSVGTVIVRVYAAATTAFVHARADSTRLLRDMMGFYGSLFSLLFIGRFVIICLRAVDLPRRRRRRRRWLARTRFFVAVLIAGSKAS